jgi:hypothetical protein
LVVVTDVVNSTQAVNAGKYVEVNYLGAACIVAAGNAAPELTLASVFGGDGATLVIPPEAREPVSAALLSVKRWGKSAFGLELRVGIVSMDVLERHGASLLVAKMEFSRGNDMAMFRGNALDLADKLVKEGDGNRSYELADSGHDDLPNLNTLSCRWQPLSSENGHILCLLVRSLSDSVSESDKIYSELLEQIDRLIGLNEVATSPIKLSNTRLRFPSNSIIREAKGRRGNYWLNLARVTLLHSFIFVIDFFRINVGEFDPGQYRRELTVNADFRKMKGSLSLVVDCSEAQTAQIEGLLVKLRAAGRIVYGLYRAPHALMTCVVPSASDHEHVHFIDGGDGGLWRAAELMKRQMREASGVTGPARAGAICGLIPSRYFSSPPYMRAYREMRPSLTP